ncbi:MAG: hypothetical protein ACO20N_14730, partial [bacterium]
RKTQTSGRVWLPSAVLINQLALLNSCSALSQHFLPPISLLNKNTCCLFLWRACAPPLMLWQSTTDLGLSACSFSA